MTLVQPDESTGEPRAADEPAPDSTRLRISHKTAHESGIPPARDRLARPSEASAATIEQLEMVLVESTRAEANLGLLLRGLKHLSNGANAAREANALLVLELESLRGRVTKVYEHESVMEKRIEQLENALDAASRERASWFDQEDAFLADLLTDHEQQLLDVQYQHDQRLAELARAFEELRTQRDQARTEVSRLCYERDAAIALLNEPVASTEPAPSPLPPPSSPSGANTLGALKLKPALKSKPAVSSRPLIGYSMTADDVPAEQLEGASRASRPPRP